jgi:pyruvate/2-oxoglutarate dehydrogenase complex dihydrolipoamide acyltransferase (E2) component
LDSSLTVVVVKASALALAEVPEANSAWLGETIRK